RLAASRAALVVGTRLRFGSDFGFPPYACPAVFVALTAVTLVSMLLAGEYFESRPSVRKALAALMATFFVLSSLTYFFKDFAFSRVVLLMTVAAATVASAAARVALLVYDKSVGRDGNRRIAIAGASELSVRFHVALDYDEIVAARIINEVSGIEPTVPHYNIRRVRYRLVKRAFDLAGALFLLTLGLSLVYLIADDLAAALRGLWAVVRGRASIVGLYPLEGETPRLGKVGLTGLAHISRPARLTRQVIRELNDYYVQNYTFALDFDILVKTLLRRA